MALSRKMESPAGGSEPRRWPVLAAAMLAMFTAAVEGTIVATAMPTIVAELGGFSLLSWVFVAYLLAQTVTIPIYGRLSDVYGRKPVFFVGMGLFLTGSLLCGFAWGMIPLICFRALQGLGAGAITPIASTVVGDIYAPEERARKQGYLSSVWGVSGLVGPVLGAFLVEKLNWSLVFWINLPVGAAAIVMLALFLPERMEKRRHRIDYPGSLLLITAAGTLMLAMSEMRNLSGPVLAVLTVIPVAALIAFVRHEGNVEEPMMPIDLWRNRVIAVGNAGALAIGAVLMSVAAFLPPYVQGVMGGSVAMSGFILATVSVGWPLASIIAGRLMVRTSYRLTAVLGGLALVAGGIVLIALDPSWGPLWAGSGAFVVGIGLGFCNTTFLVSIQASVDWDRRGVATSSNIFSRMMGQALGAAMFGAILNGVVYRQLPGSGDAVNRLMDPALRGGMDAGTIHRLAGAVADGLHDVFIVAALVSVVALVLAALLPARLSPGSHRR